WNPRYDYRLERRLARVSCPTSVITPDEDRLVPRVFAERYAELITGARLVTISDERTPTGHGVVAQQPKRLAECVAASAGSA
ncbi:MAG TPA: hypothetical protein VNT22_11210, partial [Baekduia sp.]|nr:hypothetical protein [Baekduia sp.]